MPQQPCARASVILCGAAELRCRGSGRVYEIARGGAQPSPAERQAHAGGGVGAKSIRRSAGRLSGPAHRRTVHEPALLRRGVRATNDVTAIFDTPTLVEIWCAAPYLRDRSAATLRDVRTTANRGDRHGRISHLTARQIDDLVEIWRAAPYLRDRSAATLRDVRTTANRGDRHGRISHLTARQIDDLVEIWRAAPYLRDRSAATLRDVRTTANRGDRHGRISHLTARQIDDLVEIWRAAPYLRDGSAATLRDVRTTANRGDRTTKYRT